MDDTGLGSSSGSAAAAGGYGSTTGMGLTALGGVVDAYAQYQSGQANKRIARFNAGVAKQQATQAIQTGEFVANRVSIREQQMQGASRAAEAGSGIVAGAGTARLVEASNEAQSEMDKRMIELNARRQAYGFQTKAMGDTMQGNLAAQRGEMSAASTLMNTGSQLWLESDPNFAGFRGAGVRFA